ncbi:MAG: hypothetical protein MUQ30_04560 [Anaerolineae bacterium]|nr:hypothetical protein [Anaerolineae bacterium]
MPQKDWDGQSIIFLIMFFLTCSALGIAYKDIARIPPSGDPAATSERHYLTFPIDYAAAEVLGAGLWCPAVTMENLGSGEATIEIALHDANGAELLGTFTEGRPISLPAGGSATIPLAGAEGLPAGQVSCAISSNQPITGTVVHQATPAEMQDNDLWSKTAS